MRSRRRRALVAWALVASALVAVGAMPIAAQSPPGRLEGEIVDSLGTPAPLAHAEVWLVGSALRATSDVRGRFRIDAVPAGAHEITFFHPVLDSLGLTAPSATVVVRAGERARVRLATPSGPALFARACGRTPEPHEGAVFGAVRDAAREAPAAAQVSVEWLEYVAPDGERRGQPPELMRRIARTRSDTSGRFVVCGVPNLLALEVQATGERGASGLLKLQLGRRFLTTTQLHLGASDTVGRATASVAGRVLSPEGTPVADAIVATVDEAFEARTDSLGRFRLGDVPTGTQTIVARAIGFAPVERAVVVRDGGTTEETMTLQRTATALPGVRVVDRGPRTRAYPGFVERQRRGWGTFLDSMQVERTKSLGVAGMLRTSPAVLVVRTSSPPENRVYLLRHGRRCDPDVWIDGIFQRPGDGGIERMIEPDNVIAVEIYRGLEIPAPFQRPSFQVAPCGAIVIWSRIGDRARAR